MTSIVDKLRITYYSLIERIDNVRIEDAIQERFKCSKCGGHTCHTKEVAMTGTGLSKLLDIQHNHYLFVSCGTCGYVEIYNPKILEGKSRGQLGTVLDILFG